MGINKGGHGGVVINTGSEKGFYGFALGPVYSACKHGVHGLTMGYGTDSHFKRTGVKVGAVCPDAVDTPLYRSFLAHFFGEEEAVKGRLIRHAITPDEVAKSLIQILKDGKNGALLRVDKNGTRYA